MAVLDVLLDAQGSPPRVRSRRASLLILLSLLGITSACAEQTGYCHCSGPFIGDHLRVCGADVVKDVLKRLDKGSPPRVRSRRERVPCEDQSGGITSACAEQTPYSRRTPYRRPDHLRVCGADDCYFFFVARGLGSPPRVRSRPEHVPFIVGHLGITSACAEQTYAWRRHYHDRGDHLRVCGADYFILRSQSI